MTLPGAGLNDQSVWHCQERGCWLAIQRTRWVRRFAHRLAGQSWPLPSLTGDEARNSVYLIVASAEEFRSQPFHRACSVALPFSFARRERQRYSACKSARDSITNVGHPHLGLKWRCEKLRAFVQQFSKTDGAMRAGSTSAEAGTGAIKKRLAPLTGEGVSITSRFTF